MNMMINITKYYNKIYVEECTLRGKVKTFVLFFDKFKFDLSGLILDDKQNGNITIYILYTITQKFMYDIIVTRI